MAKKEFSLAIIGCGRWGMNHLRTAADLLGNNIRYVCDVNDKNLKQGQKILSEKNKSLAAKIKFVTTIEDILNDVRLNSVIIATPAESHYTLSKQCLEAGKNVLVEKPLSLFSYQAKELEKLSKQKKKILMVGHLLLFHPAIRKIKQLVDNGTIGRLQYIYSNRLNLGTVRKEENILWSFAPHDISVLQYLIEADPVEIDASGATFLQPGIHDVTLTTLHYPNNIHAHIHVSWLHPFKEHRLVIIGDKSMVVFEDSRQENKLILFPKGIDWIEGEPRKRDEDFQVVDYKADQPLRLEQKHFADCVKSAKQPLTDGINGIKVLEILEVAQSRLEKIGREGDKAKSPSPEAEKKYFVHSTAVVDEGCKIGERTKIWHYSHVQGGSKIGKNCVLGQNVNVGNNVKIGNFVKIQNNVSVYEGVELEDYVFCGPSMVFTNILNPRSEFPQRGSEFYIRTLVKYGASIGANATIVCGVSIGRFAFIGASAVVTKDVPEYALVVGNPGRIVGWMCRCGVKLKFDKNKAKCKKCNRKYRKSGERVEFVEE